MNPVLQNTKPKTVAVIVAAGCGSRMGSDLPKQYLNLQGQPMLRHSALALARHPDVDALVVVIGAGQEELAKAALAGIDVARIVAGGSTRRESALAGLLAAQALHAFDYALIHDAARPFLKGAVIDRLLTALEGHPGAIPALPIVDSLAHGDTLMQDTVDRDGLWRVQTPQAFVFDDILAAHQKWDRAQEATDDARMLKAAGHDVAIVEGDEALTKYTFADDLADTAALPVVRVGNGHDVHRLAEGEELWLCGIKIAHTHGLAGHSDADVAIHALVDAILGAAALGDIGDHFPPSDPKWKGASSDQFLHHAIALARTEGFELSNADVTIICEAPKIGPHKQAMRDRLAEILAVQAGAISVKATTTEKLGFTGRREGIAAQASVILTG